MTKTYFSELMESFGCTSVDNIAFGVADGFPYSAEILPGSENDEVHIRFVLSKPVGQAAEQLQEKKRKYLQWYGEEDLGNAGEVLVALVVPPSDFYIKSTVFTALKDGADVLRGLELEPPHVCPVCGKGDGDSYGYIFEGYRHTHAKCVQEDLKEEEPEALPASKAEGSLVRGILGALFGAFVAVVPNWARALSKGKISGVMYALMPVFSALLYRVFRGRKNRLAALLCILGSCLVVAFGLELFWFWLVVYTQQGYTVTMAQTTAFYFENYTLGLTIREMLGSLLFMFVGFLPAGVLLQGYTEQTEPPVAAARSVAFSRKTLQPLESPEQAEGILKRKSNEPEPAPKRQGAVFTMVKPIQAPERSPQDPPEELPEEKQGDNTSIK